MSYEQIKANLQRADRLAVAGHVKEADELVRACLPLGLTANDVSHLVSKQGRQALRRFERGRA